MARPLRRGHSNRGNSTSWAYADVPWHVPTCIPSVRIHCEAKRQVDFLAEPSDFVGFSILISHTTPYV